MIKSVEIKNFKNIRDQRIDLDRLTVFVGANASGKTSVLEAIHLADRGTERHCDWLYTRGGVGDMVISCTTPEGTLTVSATPPPGFPPLHTESHGNAPWKLKRFFKEEVSHDRTLWPGRYLAFLRLNSKMLARATYTDRVPPHVAHDGKGLASVLAYMALNDPDAFESVVEEMRQLVPNLKLKRIRFTKRPVRRMESELVRFGNETVERRSKRTYQGDAMLFDFENANNIAAQTVSEGTLVALGLLTVLLGPLHPDILLLDDIERGLHPSMQKRLLETLEKLMERFPHLQILATAHSPYLLDALKPKQIRLMALDSDGHAVCRRLTDHPEFDRWKDEMAPGELWSLFGEKWVAEGAGAK